MENQANDPPDPHPHADPGRGGWGMEVKRITIVHVLAFFMGVSQMLFMCWLGGMDFSYRHANLGFAYAMAIWAGIMLAGFVEIMRQEP